MEGYIPSNWGCLDATRILGRLLSHFLLLSHSSTVILSTTIAISELFPAGSFPAQALQTFCLLELWASN